MVDGFTVNRKGDYSCPVAAGVILLRHFTPPVIADPVAAISEFEVSAAIEGRKTKNWVPPCVCAS